MKKISPSLKLFINLAKIHTVSSRRFSGGLDGLGFSEFTIAFHLIQADGEKMRRVDLAEKMGLTASGVTRLLAPMEKIGLIKRESSEQDARVSYVTLTTAGKRNFADALVKAELFVQGIFSPARIKKLGALSDLLVEIGGSVK